MKKRGITARQRSSLNTDETRQEKNLMEKFLFDVRIVNGQKMTKFHN